MRSTTASKGSPQILMVILIALASTAASATEYASDELAKGGAARVVDDPSAEGGKAIYFEQSGPGQQFVLSAVTARLPVGSYEVSFHVKVATSGNHILPLLRFEIEEQGIDRLVYQVLTPYGVDTPDVFADYTFTVNHSSETPLSAAISSEGPTKFWVDRIRIERSRKFRIASVWPGKILEPRNADATGTVVLDNGTETEQMGRLVLDLVSDVETSRRIGEISVRAPAMQRVEVPIKWNTGPEEFGFELHAVLLDANNQIVDTRGTYFGVSDTLWQVAMTGVDTPWDLRFPWPAAYPLQLQTVAEQDQKFVEALRRPVIPNDAFWTYSNWREYYAWAPDDFFDLTPTRDHWWSGTGWYLVSRKSLVASIELGHRLGIRQITYAQPFGMGDRTYGELRKHPEWFLYDAKGEVKGSFDVKSLDLQRQPDYAAHTVVEQLQKEYPYTSARLNFANRETVDRGITELINSAKMFGWDGVRWDNTYYRVEGDGYDFGGRQLKEYGDPQDQTIAVIRHFKTRFAEELGPSFAIGYNVEQELHRSFAPRAWDELPRGGELLMDESIRASYETGTATNQWSEYAARINREGKVIRSLGGHSLVIGLDRQNPVDQLYQQVFTFASRVHSYGNYRFFDLPYGNYAEFVTRYSALLFDIANIKPLEKPEQKVEVHGDKEIWWRDWACVRTAPSGGRQYLIHLINPPANARIYADASNTVPAKQKNVRISLKSGEKLVSAWLLSAEPRVRASRLEVGSEALAPVVTVPELGFWSLVVLEVQ